MSNPSAAATATASAAPRPTAGSESGSTAAADFGATPRVLRLREHGAPVHVELSRPQVDALLASDSRIEVLPIPGSAGTWSLRAQSRVGLLRVAPGLVVEVRPKLPIEQVLELLAYTLAIPELRRPPVEARNAPDLNEALAWIYLASLRRSLARGLPHGYVERDEDAQAVRGRLRFEDQLRQRPHTWLPLAIRHDEFTEDIGPNRVLKAALRQLLTLNLRHGQTGLELRRFLRLFGHVSDLHVGAPLPELPAGNRLTAHLQPSLELARLILRGGSLDPRAADGGELLRPRTPGLLFDLADLFERFVRETLRGAWGLSAREFPAGGGADLYLDRGRRVRLKPDLLWRTSAGFRFVGDVKYKRSAGEGATQGRRDDLYQLLSYATRCGLKHGMLIQAEAHPPQRHVVDRGAGEPTVLEVWGVGLESGVGVARARLTAWAQNWIS